jgi:hypothetical protein
MTPTTKKQTSLLAERTTLRTIIISIVLVVVGAGSLLMSTRFGQCNPLIAVFQDLGGLLMVSGAVSALWELAAKRSFLDEIRAKAQMTEELRDAGIIAYESDFRLLDWHELLDKASCLDIFFTYSRTWRNQYNRELLEMARRRTTRMRVILPDPEDEMTVKSLAHRFGMSETELVERINEAKAYFSGFGRMHPAEVEVWFYPRPPLFSFYLIDDRAVLALYHHREERLYVPAFVARGGGELYSYLRDEFEAMIDENKGLARKATTP